MWRKSWIALLPLLLVVLSLWISRASRVVDVATPSLASSPDAEGSAPVDLLAPADLRTEVGASASAVEASKPTWLGFPRVSAPEQGTWVLVRERGGGPIEGAIVRCGSGHEAVTGADGRTHLAARRHEEAVLSITAEGFFHETVPALGRSGIDVELDPAATLTGRILSAASGEPFPDATVRLLHHSTLCTEETAKSHGGTYTVTVPIGRRISFVLESEEFPSQRAGLRLEEAADWAVHDFKVVRGRFVKGTIVDTETGLGVTGAIVTSLISGTNQVEVGFDGAFEGRFLGAGRRDWVPMMAQADGYCRTSFDAGAPARRGAAELRIPLLKATYVEGVVLGFDGSPLPGVYVQVLGGSNLTRRDGTAELARTTKDLVREWSFENQCVDPRDPRALPGFTTDERGRFRSRGIVPGTAEVKIRVLGRRLGILERVVAIGTNPGETTRVELRFEEAGPSTIQGRVTLDGGSIGGKLRWRSGSRSGAERISASGWYRIADVPPGSVHLTVLPARIGAQAPFRQLPPQTSKRIEVSPGQEVEVHFELESPSGAAAITGRVFAPDGERAERAILIARCPEQLGELRARPDSGGSFSIPTPDRSLLFDIEARLGDYSTLIEGVRPGTSDLELRFLPLGVLPYRVVAKATEKSLKPFQAFWRREGDRAFRLLDTGHFREDSSGWLTARFPAGRVEVMIRADAAGFRPEVVGRIRVTAGAASAPLEFRMRRGLSLHLELEDPGLPRGARLFLVEEAATGDAQQRLARRNLRFDAAGHAAVHGLAKGSYRLEARSEDLALKPSVIRLRPRSNKPVRVSWSRN